MVYRFNESELVPAYGQEMETYSGQYSGKYTVPTWYSKNGAAVPTYTSDGSVNPQALFIEVMRLRYQA